MEVKTTREDLPVDNKTHEAHFYVEQAANAVRPQGNEYVGSFCIHVYKHTFASNPTFCFGTQFVGKVPEALAIEAAKELKERMMSRYGHEIKKRK